MASHVTTRLTSGLRAWLDPLRALPPRARFWWAATLLAAVVLVPLCLSQVDPAPPLAVLLLAPLLNGLLAIVIAPRLLGSLVAPDGALPDWRDTEIALPPDLAPGTFRSVLSDQEISISSDSLTLPAPSALGSLPLALLLRP